MPLLAQGMRWLKAWGLTGFLDCQHAHGGQGAHCLSDVSLLAVQDHFTSQSRDAAGQDNDSVPEADKIDVDRIPSFGTAEGHLTVDAQHCGALQPLLVASVSVCVAFARRATGLQMPGRNSGLSTQQASCHKSRDTGPDRQSVRNCPEAMLASVPFALLAIRGASATHFVRLPAPPAGNVARFINHSCSGNLTVQTVFTEGCSALRYRVALFSTEFIPRASEVTYDYGKGCTPQGASAAY